MRSMCICPAADKSDWTPWFSSSRGSETPEVTSSVADPPLPTVLVLRIARCQVRRWLTKLMSNRRVAGLRAETRISVPRTS